MEQIGISIKVLVTGLIMLLIGYIIMTLGTETYSFWKITVAPIIIVSAFFVIGYSIMRKKQNTDV